MSAGSVDALPVMVRHLPVRSAGGPAGAMILAASPAAVPCGQADHRRAAGSPFALRMRDLPDAMSRIQPPSRDAARVAGLNPCSPLSQFMITGVASGAGRAEGHRGPAGRGADQGATAITACRSARVRPISPIMSRLRQAGQDLRPVPARVAGPAPRRAAPRTRQAPSGGVSMLPGVEGCSHIRLVQAHHQAAHGACMSPAQSPLAGQASRAGQ
jgi:hypothetical protein